MTVDLVTLAHNYDNPEAFEAGVLAALEQTVGCDAAMFLVKGYEQYVTTLGLDATTPAKIAANGATYAQDLLPVKQAALAARGVAVDTEVCGINRVRRTSYYRDIMRTVNEKHSLLAYVPWRGRIVATLMLGRIGKGFSGQELTLLESLLPTLGVVRAGYGLPHFFAPLPSPPLVNPIRQLARSWGSGVLASAQTRCGTIVVRDRAGFREMVATNVGSELVWTRVALKDSTRSGWPYIDLLHLAPALAKHRRRALFVGSGGAVSVRQFAAAYPGITLDLVEHEPAVVEMARVWFGLDDVPHLTVHIAEGAAFIRTAQPSSWDIVVIDAYDASTFAHAFSDAKFLGVLRRVLRPGGAMACNVIGKLAGGGPVQTFVSAARTAFDTVRILPVVDPNEDYSSNALRNVVVVASRD